MRQNVILHLVIACAFGVGASADDTPGIEAIREAITLLEARKAQAEKKEDQDQIARAIADLEKLLPKAKKDGNVVEANPDAELAKLITPAAVKKKFAGKPLFNPKTNELTLVYDFLSKDELKDFELNGSKPSLLKGVMSLQAAESIRHVVKFKTLSLAGQIQINKLPGRHLKTSENIWIGGTQTEVYVMKDGGGYASVPFPAMRALTPFEFKILENRQSIRIGDSRTAIATKTPVAGHVELLGSEAGASYRKIVFQGELDAEWAREFFKK